MKRPPGPVPVLLMYNRTLERGSGRSKCHSIGALALLISVVMTNRTSALIVQGPPIPLFGFGNGNDPLLASVPIFVDANYMPTPPDSTTTLSTTMPQEPPEATFQPQTTPPAVDTGPSEPHSTTTSSNDYMTPIGESTPTAPVASESTSTRFGNKPPDGEEPTSISFWSDPTSVPSAEINAAAYPKSPQSTGIVTPGIAPLKPAQTNWSRKEYASYAMGNNPPLSTFTAYPPSEPWTRHVPTMLPSHSDSTKWYIIAAVGVLLIALVCVFILCLRSIEARKHRKMKEFVFQSGLAYPGNDQNGPTSYMDIRPCSPLAKQWKTRTFSIGSTSHLQVPSGRSTPSGTLKKSVKLMEDTNGRQRSGSGAANILAKWRSLGRSSIRKGMQHATSADVMNQSSMYSPHGFGYASRRVAPPRQCSGDCLQRQQLYCDCQDGCPRPCECGGGGGGGGGGDHDCCAHHEAPDACHATVHFNPLHEVCMSQDMCNNHVSQESVFVADDFHDCGAQQHPPAGQCMAAHAHSQPPAYASCADPSCHPAAVDCSHQHGRGARSCVQSSLCGSLCRGEHTADAVSHGSMHRPNNTRHWKTQPGTKNESADHLLSMLAQAHNLAKGMSLERRMPLSDSFPATHHSEASATSTLARRTEFDESSGYIGSSPCARSPYSMKANKTTSGGTLPIHTTRVPMPDQVAERLREKEQQQRQRQHQYLCSSCRDQQSRQATPQPHHQQQQRRKNPEAPQATEDQSGRRKQRPRTKQQRNEESGRCSRLSLHKSQGGIDKSQSTQSLTLSQDSKPGDTLKRMGRKPRTPVPVVSIQSPDTETDVTRGRGDRESAPVKAVKQSQHIEPTSASRMLKPAATSSKPALPPKPQTPQSLPPWRREALGRLTEKSSSASETPERPSAQQPLKSSSFWNVPNYGSSHLTGAPANIISNHLYDVHSGNVGSREHTDAAHFKPTGQTAWQRNRPESSVSHADSMTIANPYNELSDDLPPPHLSDLYGLASEQFNAGGANYGSHAVPELLRPRTGLPHDASATVGSHGVDLATTARNSTSKPDLSRQNTNSSTEEQQGNFYYLREGDLVVHPSSENPSHLKAPTMHYARSQYQRGTTGPGLRQVSQLSGDSFETCQTTTL